MENYEYRVVPAPHIKGRATGKAQVLASHLEACLNEQAQSGWEFVRMDMATHETKRWFRRKKSELQAVVVFRKLLVEETTLPQFVLSKQHAVHSKPILAAPDATVASQTEPAVSIPPSIENAVRGFGKGAGFASRAAKPVHRAPLVAARRG